MSKYEQKKVSQVFLYIKTDLINLFFIRDSFKFCFVHAEGKPELSGPVEGHYLPQVWTDAALSHPQRHLNVKKINKNITLQQHTAGYHVHHMFSFKQKFPGSMERNIIIGSVPTSLLLLLLLKSKLLSFALR